VDEQERRGVAWAVLADRRIAQTRRGEMLAGPTKSVAGARTVALPDVLVDELRRHVASFAESGTEGLVFVPTGRAAAAWSSRRWL
jgi:hypothetical protein